MKILSEKSPILHSDVATSKSLEYPQEFTQKKRPLKISIEDDSVIREINGKAKKGELDESVMVSRAVWASLASVMVTFLLFLASLICTFIRSSPSTAAFAADCILDSLASGIVYWRYRCEARGKHVSESTACIYLGILFVVSSLGVFAKAIVDIITQPEAESLESTKYLLWLSSLSTFAFVALAGLKYWLYRSLNNQSLFLDAINTLISGVFAIAIAVTCKVMDSNPEIWYLDALESIIFSVLMMCYGLKCVIENTCCSKETSDGYDYDFPGFGYSSYNIREFTRNSNSLKPKAGYLTLK